MPGLLSRIFRRKGNASEKLDGGATASNANHHHRSKDSLAAKSGASRGSVSSAGRMRGRWGSRSSPSKAANKVSSGNLSAKHTDRSSPTTSEDVHALNMVNPPPTGGRTSTTVASLSQSNFNSSSAAAHQAALHGSWHSPDDGDQRVISGHRNYPSPQPRRAGPVDLDDSEIDTDADENLRLNRGPRLNSQHLMQLEKQHRHSPPTKTSTSLRASEGISHQPPPQQQPSHQPLFLMKDDAPKHLFSAGMGFTQDNNNSDGDESSSFNVSTDQEDFEYENLRKLGVLPPQMDTISLSASVNNYTTDGENTVFPNLNTDDEGTTSGMSLTYSKDGSTVDPTGKAPGKLALGAMTAVPPKDTPQYRNYALGMSPAEPSGSSPPSAQKTSRGAAYSANDPSPTALTTTSTSPPTSYQLDTSSSPPATAAVTTTVSPPSASSSPNTSSGPRREFVSPKSQESTRKSYTSPSSNGDFGFDADFADFSQADFGGEWPGTKAHSAERHSSHHRRIHVETDRMVHSPSRSKSSRELTTASTMSGGHETSLPELLERAKSKSSKNRKGSSVNSAPAMSAAFLREHHGLRGRRSDGKSEGGSSVSDIIKNLDAAAAARLHSKRSTSEMSSHSRDNGSVRSAKDRFKEHRRRDSRRRSHDDSSDSDDNEASETWLFDGVQGALGPKGIAADLESLSVRSNRSHTSGGGRSHKSHRSHRSHKSHRSSRRRREKSSGESVGSQGSRRSSGSRRSRSSRYSHRSTRSYISQMSEQSRSVANDLLRLEMQLAMVADPEHAGDRPQPDVGGGRSSSRTSNHHSGRSSRQASGTSRRSRVTVVAPPGKLGIILANKADSRGTVVSGVRTSSALVERVSPGDRIVAIDGEDVSLMTVSEITTIMARKSDFERTLTVLTSPRHMSSTQLVSSPRKSGDYRY